MGSGSDPWSVKAFNTDNASFLINGDQLQTTVTFNYETQYIYGVRVRTTDQNGLSFEQPVTILVDDVNEAPTALGLSSLVIAENRPVATVVGSFSTTDPDAGNTFTYTFVTGSCDTDNASFTIAGNQLKTAAAFNFESKSAYSIRVRTSDQGGQSFEQTFAITVSNVNETPTALNISSTVVAENVSFGTVVGTFSSTDVVEPPYIPP